VAALRRTIRAALAGGIVAGLLLSALQQVWVLPLIREGERYEAAAPGPSNSSVVPVVPATPPVTSPSPPAHGVSPAGNAGAEEARAPAPGLTRLLSTVAAGLLVAVGWGLLLAAGLTWRAAREPAAGSGGALRGLLWGMAGYAVFVLAPSFGLPPELPGAPAAALSARQAWWLAAAACTGASLALWSFAPPRLRWPARALGAFLLLLPHLAGAPRPPSGIPHPLPARLAAEYVAAVLGSTALFWAVLGAVCGWTIPRRP
jgi:cobalt transporter subunit CbtA